MPLENIDILKDNNVGCESVLQPIFFVTARKSPVFVGCRQNSPVFVGCSVRQTFFYIVLGLTLAQSSAQDCCVYGTKLGGRHDKSTGQE